MGWVKVLGVLELKEGVTEESLISNYELFSHNLVGSEGGLSLDFNNKLVNKEYEEFKVSPYYLLKSCTLSGSLRKVQDGNYTNVVESLTYFLKRLMEFSLVEDCIIKISIDGLSCMYIIYNKDEEICIKEIKY